MSDRFWGINVEHKVTQSGEARICCPFCPELGQGEDTKYHLYINFTKRLFRCFRCNTAGGISKLKNFLKFNEMSTPAGIDPIRQRLKKLFAPPIPKTVDIDTVSWPIESEHCPQGFEYMLKNRKFTVEEMRNYSLRVGKSYKDKEGKLIRRWAGRVIFPFFENGEVVFLVGRSYTNKEPRYINSIGSKDYVVYGIDNIVKDECILCEGIISSIAAERITGVPAISCLGKTATKYQLSKIRSKATRVYVCLDGTSDITQKDLNSINRSLLKLGVDVWEVRPPEGKDPDDCSIEEFQHCFHRARRIRL